MGTKSSIFRAMRMNQKGLRARVAGFFYHAIIVSTILISCQSQAYAVTDWDKVSPLGTTQASDLDLNIGANGAAIDLLLANYRAGAYPYSTGSVNGFSVSAGDLVISNSDGSLRRFRSNPTATVVTWSNMDTGVGDTVSTLYHIYAVADSAGATTWTVKISTSATTPASSTYYRKLGSFYNNAAGTIEVGGIIVMFSGPVSSIPPGWALCDGTNGTPDLKDRFILAAGTSGAPGDIGPTTSASPTLFGTGTDMYQQTTQISQGTGAAGSGNSGGFHEHRYMPRYYVLAFIQKQGVE